MGENGTITCMTFSNKIHDRESCLELGKQMISPKCRRWKSIARHGCSEWRCIVLTVIIVGCFISLLWCTIQSHNRIRFISPYYSGLVALNNQQASPRTYRPPYCQPVHYCIMSALITMFYLIYLFECWNSHTRNDLATANDIAVLSGHIQEAVTNAPRLWWISYSYHYVRRVFRGRVCRGKFYQHHCRPRYVETGLGQLATTPNHVNCVFGSSMKTCAYDKVISSVKQYFLDEAVVGEWTDLSPDICWDTSMPGVQIHFTKEFIFANEATRKQYEIRKKDFSLIQEQIDNYTEIKEGFQLYNECNLPPSVLLLRHQTNRPMIFRPILFLLASLFLLSWPLRMIIYARTAKLKFSFRKVLSCASQPLSDEERSSSPTPSSSHLCHDQTTQGDGKDIIFHNTGFDNRRGKATSDTDDDLLSIDIRFNDFASK